MKNSSIDTHITRNTSSVASAEFLWGLGMPVLLDSTFLQIFIPSLGGSNHLIGAIPSIFSGCSALFAPLSAMLTSHLTSKRNTVFFFHIFCGFPVIAYGIILPYCSKPSALTLFIILYTVFSVFLGTLLPLWQNFLTRIFSPKMILKSLSVMFISQIVARILGGIAIAWYIKQYPLEARNGSGIFICAGSLFIAGAIPFLFVNEGKPVKAREKAHSFRSLFHAIRTIVGNKNFRFFMLSTLELTALTCVIAFFAKFAHDLRGINASVAGGLFTSALFSGAIIANIVFGWVGFLSIKRKYIASKCALICAITAIIFASSLPIFIAAAFVMGISRGIVMLSYTPAVKAISGQADATDYFSALPIAMLPFSVGIPVAAGFILDYFGSTLFSYQIMFALMIGITIASIWFIGKVKRM